MWIGAFFYIFYNGVDFLLDGEIGFGFVSLPLSLGFGERDLLWLLFELKSSGLCSPRQAGWFGWVVALSARGNGGEKTSTRREMSSSRRTRCPLQEFACSMEN